MGRRKKSATPLKDLIARASLRVVERHGPDALTLRAAAKEARAKSERSPMLYYPAGAVQLLALVATEGFRDLIAAMTEEPQAREPVERVRELVARYVGFGEARPNLYRAMFHRHLAEGLENSRSTVARKAAETFDTLRTLKRDAYDILVQPLEQLEGNRLLRRPGHPRDFGLAVAALAHGLVGEYIDEGLWKDEGEGFREGVTVSATDALLYGILEDGATD